MEKAKVYFSDLRTSPTSNLLDKMERLLKRAGIGQLPLKDSFTAIKIHFGEPGNLAYIRPNYAARMANLLRSFGAKPFLTDCNTLYSGRRSNAVDHLQSAMENGFNPISAQCQVIIADGLKGTDYREIPVDGEYCPAPKIGTAIADADIIISMNHFKGHEPPGQQGGAAGTLLQAPGADPRPGPPHQPHHRPSRRGGGGTGGALRLFEGGPHRAGRCVPLLPGGGHARGQNAEPGGHRRGRAPRRAGGGCPVPHHGRLQRQPHGHGAGGAVRRLRRAGHAVRGPQLR